MKALCVTPERNLEVRDIPLAGTAAPGHVLIDMEACAINHGDKTFLKVPTAAGTSLSMGPYDVWGASGAGRVVATGEGVPSSINGRKVAVYRSLDRSPESVGLWSERSHVRHTNCLVLPEHVNAKDYAGSLVNVMTAFAFLDEVADLGHRSVLVTAGSSATGQALASLARHRSLPVIMLVRSEAVRNELLAAGIEHVVVIDERLPDTLAALTTRLETTAVFDGVGGELLGFIAPHLPMRSTIYTYGVLGGNTPVSIPSLTFMMKDLTLRRFSNFESATVKDHSRLMGALRTLEGLIDDPMLRTVVGREFSLDRIDDAMAYAPADGSKAILVF